jgi:hypothetical protein
VDPGQASTVSAARLWIATVAVIILVVVVWKIIDFGMEPPPPPAGEVRSDR